MAITEQGRHKMYSDLEAAIGPESAAVLMEHLPPVGWADVATKRDLDQFATELRLEFRAELQRGLRVQLVTFLTANAAMLGVVVAALKA